jgi:uncharacterized protein
MIPTAGLAQRPASSRSPLTFFALAYALSVPFWVIGAGTELQLLPGLPPGALMVVCPLVAASILVYRVRGTEGVIALLERSFDYGRIRAKVWYVPVVFLRPAVATVAYALMRATGLPLPTPRFPVLAPVMLIAFFVAGLAEELGWSGYVTDPLQDRWSALGAGIVIGMAWAAWHIIPLVQAHRTATWIA